MTITNRATLLCFALAVAALVHGGALADRVLLDGHEANATTPSNLTGVPTPTPTPATEPTQPASEKNSTQGASACDDASRCIGCEGACSGGGETGNLTSTSCGPGNCGPDDQKCGQCPGDCCDYGTTGCCYGVTNCGVYGDAVCSVPDRANCGSMPPDGEGCTIPPECNCDYGTSGTCCWGDGSAQCGGKSYGCRNKSGKGKCVPV